MNTLAHHDASVADSPTGLVSMLSPCCGQIEYTKLCVASVLRYGRKPVELIFLDTGSLDGTRELLAGIGLAAQVRVEVVRTASDLGIGNGIDEALQLARGEFVCLHNSDTIVSENWLTQMVNLAQLTPTIGIVGPMSNYAPEAQRVPKVPYRIGPKKNGKGDWLVDTGAVEAFARQWREEHRGQWKAVDSLGGFCLLIKRDVLRRIGRLRESSQLGLFDTNELCKATRQAGFTLAVAGDVYVHHFGTRVFAQGAPTSG
jgi:GT2 family glycosyltransferase